MIMEVTESTYIEFYKLQRRQKYIDERSRDNKDISYDSLTTDEFNGEDNRAFQSDSEKERNGADTLPRFETLMCYAYA